jgi:hypothetical protein
MLEKSQLIILIKISLSEFKGMDKLWMIKLSNIHPITKTKKKI